MYLNLDNATPTASCSCSHPTPVAILYRAAQAERLGLLWCNCAVMFSSNSAALRPWACSVSLRIILHDGPCAPWHAPSLHTRQRCPSRRAWFRQTEKRRASSLGALPEASKGRPHGGLSCLCQLLRRAEHCGGNPARCAALP